MHSDPRNNGAGQIALSQRRFFIGASALWLLAAFVTGQHIIYWPIGAVVAAVLFFAVPIALAATYISTVRRAVRLTHYNPDGRIHRFLRGRLFSSLWWMAWAVASSLVVLVQFTTYAWIQWLFLGVLIPVFWCIYALAYRLLSGELSKGYVVTSLAIRLSSIASPPLVILLYALFLVNFGGVTTYESLNAALEAQRAGSPAHAETALVDIVLQVTTFSHAGKALLTGMFGSIDERLPLFLMVLGTYVMFFNACATIACFVIRPAEYRRVFGPISDELNAPRLTNARIAAVTALITLAIYVLLVQSFISLDQWARRTDASKKVAQAEAVVKQLLVDVERIDGALYNPGTAEKIRAAQSLALAKLSISRAELDGKIDLSFARMEHKVDSYLDWYYSLSGEYMRLAKYLLGELETFMTDKLTQHLAQGDVLREISGAMAAVIANNEGVLEEYQIEVKRLKDANLSSTTLAQANVVKDVAIGDSLKLPSHLDIVSFKDRMSGGVFAGGVSAVITTKVVGKGTLKTAAKALSKVAVSKATGTGVGTAAGAAVGSILGPIGAIVGGVVGGLAAGVIVDKLMLELEEVLSRDQFKRELLAAIQEAKVSFKSALLGAL